VIALMLCLLFGVLAQSIERSSCRRYVQEVRAMVLQEAALIASRVEAEVNSSFFLIAGLASYIGLKKEITQEEYAKICERMYGAIPGLVNITAAPDLVNRYVYPFEGNEAVLGLDYGEFPQQLAAIERMKYSKKPVVAGPFDLIQGGEAIIGRFPVFVPDGAYEAERFWGMISTPILTEVLYREADLPLNSAHLEIALRGKDGLGAAGGVFLGERELFHSGAVLFPIVFFNGSWEMALAPKEGWPTQSPVRWLIYGVCAAVCLLCVLILVGLCFYFKRVNEAREMEQSVQLAKERFYSNMSHEIRTPLNAIFGLSEMIAETTEEAFTRESAETISKSSHALTELISDVLFLSEDSLERGRSSRDTFDANDLLREVLAPIRPEVERKNLHLRIEELPAGEAEICTSKQHLRQILWNLALNAVKFTEKGTVTFRLYRKEDTLFFQCTDTGIGIDEQFQPELFKAFTQEDSSMTRRFGGAGLGLAIVKRSIDTLHGEVCFESLKGEGTTFWVKVPLGDS
jgi:two-component system sensor histidine kinase ChiS